MRVLGEMLEHSLGGTTGRASLERELGGRWNIPWGSGEPCVSESVG